MLDVQTLERDPAPAQLGLNDIGRVRLRTSAPLVFDAYKQNRRTGSFILIDESEQRDRRRRDDRDAIAYGRCEAGA